MTGRGFQNRIPMWIKIRKGMPDLENREWVIGVIWGCVGDGRMWCTTICVCLGDGEYLGMGLLNET